MAYEIKTVNSDQIVKTFTKIITPPYQRPLDGQHLKQLTETLADRKLIIGVIVLCKLRSSYYIVDGQHRYYVMQTYLTRKVPKIFKVSFQVIPVQKEDEILYYYQMCNNVNPHSELDQEVIDKKGSSTAVQKNKTISGIVSSLRSDYPEHFKNLKKLTHYTYHLSQAQLKKELGDCSFYDDPTLLVKIMNCNNHLEKMSTSTLESLIKTYRGKGFSETTMDGFHEIEKKFYLSLFPFEAWKVLLDKHGEPIDLM